MSWARRDLATNNRSPAATYYYEGVYLTMSYFF